jgi:hypothetical protein
MASQEILREERSLGDLFSELAEETSTLVRQEVALAQTELTEKAARVGKNVGFLVVGGAVGYAALLAVLVAVVIGLAVFIPAWLAALIVGLGAGAAAYLIISPALDALKKTDLTPRETVRSLKEDVQWLKKQMN